MFEKIKVNVCRVEGYHGPLPEYQTAGASGFDMSAHLSEPKTLKPGDFALISTGLSFEIPAGYEMQVRPRSGLAAKFGISVVNSPGTVDADYRGEVKVILINLGSQDFQVKNGDRIAQGVICPVVHADWKLVERLGSSERGTGGFGSTGKN